MVRLKRLGEILVEESVITDIELSKALDYQKEHRIKLGEAVIRLSLASESDILIALSRQLGLDIVDLSNVRIEDRAIESVPKNICLKYGLMPYAMKDGRLVVAFSDPLNIHALDDIKYFTGMNIERKLAAKSEILKAVDFHYSYESSENAINELKIEMESLTADTETGDDAKIMSAPVVKLVNSLLSRAVKMKASDLHMEPFEDSVRVRMRIDGILSEIMTIPKNVYSSVVSRVKIISGMNIAEKRLPLDGRTTIEVEGKEYDLRTSTLPTVHGEKIVIRFLGALEHEMSLMELGFDGENLSIIEKLIDIPYGIILVTGPTGSGKSTTLYSMLRAISSVEKNIVTVEDPVENVIEGINQVHVNAKAGLTFASGLRSILRQDPDIVMVGEIRDEETAEIAIRAALTGHLVLSTLHTNDSSSAVSRLIDMGIKPYLLSDSLLGVVAQRLVRKVCAHCSVLSETTDSETAMLGESVQIKRIKGCPKCNFTGYSGRTTISEVLYLDKEMRKLVEEGASVDSIRDAALRKGMDTLFESAKKLVLKGETTISEMVRVAYGRE